MQLACIDVSRQRIFIKKYVIVASMRQPSTLVTRGRTYIFPDTAAKFLGGIPGNGLRTDALGHARQLLHAGGQAWFSAPLMH
jgi:hypothetical protein